MERVCVLVLLDKKGHRVVSQQNESIYGSSDTASPGMSSLRQYNQANRHAGKNQPVASGPTA